MKPCPKCGKTPCACGKKAPGKMKKAPPQFNKPMQRKAGRGR